MCFYELLFWVSDHIHGRLCHFSFAYLMHFLVYLCAPSLTSLPSQIHCLEDILDFFIAGSYSYFCLSFSVKPCYNWFWWIISILYVWNLSGQHLTKTGLCASLDWLNRCTWLFITLMYFLPLWIWQGLIYTESFAFSSPTVGTYILIF